MCSSVGTVLMSGAAWLLNLCFQVGKCKSAGESRLARQPQTVSPPPPPPPPPLLSSYHQLLQLQRPQSSVQVSWKYSRLQ